jgi:hypothetical protein
MLAQTASKEPSAIRIIRKPGHEAGEAQMTVNGKVRKISPHAVDAFTARGSDAALVIVLQPAKGGLSKQYVLHYYDLDSGRRRVLGTLPMSAAQLQETEAKGGAWAFALSGTDLTTSKPMVMVGDDQAIPGRLPDASSPVFHEGVLSYTTGGETREAKLDGLLGSSRQYIYAPPQGPQAAPKFLQVFPDGTAMVMTANGVVHKATWQTDGLVVQIPRRGSHPAALYGVAQGGVDTLASDSTRLTCGVS